MSLRSAHRSAVRALSATSAVVALGLVAALPAQADPDPASGPSSSPTAGSDDDAGLPLPGWLRSDPFVRLLAAHTCMINPEPLHLVSHDGGAAVHYVVHVRCGRDVPYELRMTLTDVYGDSGSADHLGAAPVERQGAGGAFDIDGYSRPCVSDEPSEWKVELHSRTGEGQNTNVTVNETTLDCRI